MGFMEEQDAKAQRVVQETILPTVTELLEVFERYGLTQAQAAIAAGCALNRMPLKNDIPRIAIVRLR